MATRRAGETVSDPSGFFNGSALGERHRDPVRDDAGNLNAQARLQSDGTLLGFKQRVRSCCRWQLWFCRWINEDICILGMHLRFRNPRRSQVAPASFDSMLF